MSNSSRTADHGKTGKTSSTSTATPPPPPPPTPSFIFRGHDAPIHSLEFFSSNTFLVTGDEAGWICVWDIWKRRPVCKWHGHKTGSVLALKAIPIHRDHSTPASDTGATEKRRTRLTSRRIEAAAQDRVYIVSHGRDNEIHFWDINSVLQESVRRSSMAIVILSDKEPIFSLPVNALNFCKLSILAIDASPAAVEDNGNDKADGNGQGAAKTTPMKSGAGLLRKTHRHIYVAVPSPTTSSLIDIYDVTKPERTFAAVGPGDNTGTPGGLSKSNHNLPSGSDKKWGAVMSIRLFRKQATDGVEAEGTLHMLAGYEDGSVTLFRESTVALTAVATPIVTQGTNAAKKGKRAIEVVWSSKYHREPVLAVDVSSRAEFAISCGSDNVLVKYDLSSLLLVQGTPEVIKVALKANGMADGKIRGDQKVIGLAGWDGRIRLFSVKTLKPLAVLKYHREGLYCLGFADIKEQHQQQQENENANERDKKEKEQEEEEGEKEVPLSASSSDHGGAATPATTNTADAIGEHDGDKDGGSREKEDDDNDEESESESDSDSDLEDALADRQRWSKRHWIAVGGKENRISLWEIY
ncbi:ASTRA complex subunit [Mortierella sp. NVP41]|nr:ASTRA complex subunit [Mortierella sp. NVP41]